MDDYRQHSGPPPDSAPPEWIAGRIETLLSHYFQPNQPENVTEAAMTDWIRLLHGMPRHAISTACDGYIRDQPRRRPSPGDIFNRARTIAEEKRRTAIAGPGGLDEDEVRVVDWATENGHLTRQQALDAVSESRAKTDWPMWLPESAIHRGVYCVRHHPQTRYKMKEAS